MTTTACDDQFVPEPVEPVRQPYDTAAILRRNVADAEKEMQRQAERAESYAEAMRSLASYVGAGGYNADTVDAGVFEDKIRWGIGEIQDRLAGAIERELVARTSLIEARNDIQTWIDSRNEWMKRAEAAESELEAVREDNHTMMLEIHNLRIERDALASELAKLREQEPVAWVDADGDYYAGRNYPNAWPTAVPLYVAPIPAPAVPTDEQIHAAYRNALGQSIRERDMPEIRKFAIALLQSADHSERNLEKVAPDCQTCANRGRVNGLSQESYCDGCVYQGRSWRKNHFVDAVKRRCEACAILPCSCK